MFSETSCITERYSSDNTISFCNVLLWGRESPKDKKAKKTLIFCIQLTLDHYFRESCPHLSSSFGSQRKRLLLLWLLLWWEQCLKPLFVCMWKKPWCRSDRTLFVLSDKPYIIPAQWYHCQRSSLKLPYLFSAERLWSTHLPRTSLLTANLHHVTSCFSLLTHCESSVGSSNANR